MNSQLFNKNLIKANVYDVMEPYEHKLAIDMNKSDGNNLDEQVNQNDSNHALNNNISDDLSLDEEMEEKRLQQQLLNENIAKYKNEYSQQIEINKMNSIVKDQDILWQQLINQSVVMTKQQQITKDKYQQELNKYKNQGKRIKSAVNNKQSTTQMDQMQNASDSDMESEDTQNTLQSKLQEKEGELEQALGKIVLEQQKIECYEKMAEEFHQVIHQYNNEVEEMKRISRQFDITMQQNLSKQQHFEQELHDFQEENQKFDKYLNEYQQYVEFTLQNKHKKIDDNKQELNQCVLSQHKQKSQLEEATVLYNETIQDLVNANSILKKKGKLMLKSRCLLKELDQFDLLTHIFIYNDPDTLDLTLVNTEKNNFLNKTKDEQSQLTEEKELDEFIKNSEEEAQQSSPIYKQGTVLQRLKNFFRKHNNNLDEVANQIIKRYKQYVMNNQELHIRFQDLQEQKKLLSVECRQSQQQIDKIQKIIQQRKYQNLDFEESNEHQQQQNKKAVFFTPQKEQSMLSRIAANNTGSGGCKEMNEIESIVNYQFHKLHNQLKHQCVEQSEKFGWILFFYINETLFRFIGLLSVIQRNVQNANPENSVLKMISGIKSIQQNSQNMQFCNLKEAMKFVIENKAILLEINNKQMNNQQQQTIPLTSQTTHDNNKKGQQNLELDQRDFISEKMFYIKQRFFEQFPDQKQEFEQIMQQIYNDVDLKYFCTINDYKECISQDYEPLSNMAGPYINSEINQIIIQDMLAGLKERGKQQFSIIIEKMFNYLQQITSQLIINLNYLREYGRDPNQFSSQILYTQKTNSYRKIKKEEGKRRDWKTKLINRKINQFNKYTGQIYERENRDSLTGDDVFGKPNQDQLDKTQSQFNFQNNPQFMMEDNEEIDFIDQTAQQQKVNDNQYYQNYLEEIANKNKYIPLVVKSKYMEQDDVMQKYTVIKQSLNKLRKTFDQKYDECLEEIQQRNIRFKKADLKKHFQNCSQPKINLDKKFFISKKLNNNQENFYKKGHQSMHHFKNNSINSSKIAEFGIDNNNNLNNFQYSDHQKQIQLSTERKRCKSSIKLRPQNSGDYAQLQNNSNNKLAKANRSFNICKSAIKIILNKKNYDDYHETQESYDKKPFYYYQSNSKKGIKNNHSHITISTYDNANTKSQTQNIDLLN